MFGHLTTVTVGIDEEPSLEFTVYPNPVTDGYLFIQTSQQPDEINIYNMNGQMVTSQKIQGEMSVQIILPELPQGMYIAEVRSGAYSGRKKIIISH